MKSLSEAITIIATAALLVTTAARAQVTPAREDPPDEEIVEPIVPNLPGAPAAALHLAQRAWPSTDTQLARAQAALADADIGSIDFTADGPVVAQPRTLLIRSSEHDAKALSSMSEDLRIMSRILRKAVSEKGLPGEKTPTAMGMTLRTWAWSGSASAQNIYLEGYGALFFVPVHFPLVAPPNPEAEDRKEKDATSSTWEEARKELYGSKGPRVIAKSLWKGPQAEAFDPKKVNKLKEGILEALQNATHIRNLKPGEFVTVVVLGPDNASSKGTVTLRSQNERTKEIIAHVNRFAVSGPDWVGRDDESVLTIRVKKSDVDAFAKGDLDLEKFKQKAAISVY